MVPVSVRAEAERGALGNRVADDVGAAARRRRRPARRLRAVHDGDERPQGVRAGRRRRDAHAARRLRAADDHEPGRAAAGAPALLQPRRSPTCPGPQFALFLLGRRMRGLYPRRAAGQEPGARHRDHVLQRPRWASACCDATTTRCPTSRQHRRAHRAGRDRTTARRDGRRHAGRDVAARCSGARAVPRAARRP